MQTRCTCSGCSRGHTNAPAVLSTEHIPRAKPVAQSDLLYVVCRFVQTDYPDLTGDLQVCRGQQQSRRSAKRSNAAPGQPAGGRAVLKRRGRSLRVDIPPAGLTGELLLSA